MGKIYGAIDERLTKFIAQQPVFFERPHRC